MEYKACLLVFVLSVVRCEQCYEEDLGALFNSDSDLCQAQYNWTFNQSSVTLDEDTVSNILTPSVQPSCIYSKKLSFISGSVLEIKVYTKSITIEDYLTVFAYGEDDNVVGEATLFEEDNVLNDGWHVLKVTLGGVGHYDGHVMLLGKASLNSDILVGSICNYSPLQQQGYEEKTQLATHYDTPDIYSLQTGSILKYSVHPNEKKENEIDSNADVAPNERNFWIFDEDFWSPLTISIVVAIAVILLALLSWGCFALGKRKGTKDPQIIYEDVDNLPKPYVVPRVKSVYAESVTASTFGGRNNNNIYSV